MTAPPTPDQENYGQKMTPREFKNARLSLDLTVSEMADLMETDRRSVERYEAGDKPITNPIKLLMQAFLSGWRPDQP